MATRAYIGSKFYNLIAFTGEKGILCLTSEEPEIMNYAKFSGASADILDACKDKPFIYVEPEDRNKHN